jgi:hypothetical protein
MTRRQYSPVYVSRLKDMLALHTKKEMDFVCFTNLPKREFRGDIRIIPLEKQLPGWWSKLEMFRPGLDVEKRVLALDIDMLIVGDIDMMINFPAPIAFTDFRSYATFSDKPKVVDSYFSKKGFGKFVTCYSSDVIAFDRGSLDCLFTDFKSEYMTVYRGDQDWMGDCLGKKLPKFPRAWARKMSTQDQGSRPLHIGQAKVIGCHPVKNHQLATSGYTYADRIWKGEVPC